MAEQQANNRPSEDELIELEWTAIQQIREILSNTDLSAKERTSAAGALANHVKTIHDLIAQSDRNRGDSDLNFGDYIKRFGPRCAGRFRRDYGVWKRRLSHRR